MSSIIYDIDTFITTHYEPNEDKIIMINDPTGGLDTSKIAAYKKDMPEQTHSVIDYLAEHLRYVPFNEFYDAIRACARLFTVKLFRQKEYFNLIIPDAISTYTTKSNFWVTLLFIRALDEISFPIHLYVRHVVIHIQDSTRNLADLRDIYIDDCAYSGRQMGEYVGQSNALLIYPFISEPAKALFETNPGTELLLSKNIVPSVFEAMTDEQIYNKYDMLYTTNMGETINSFIIDDLDMEDPSTKCLIYFQHKFADSVSTAVRFYNFAPLFSEEIWIYNKPNNAESTGGQLLEAKAEAETEPIVYGDYVDYVATNEVDNSIAKAFYSVPRGKKCVNLVKNCNISCMPAPTEPETCIESFYKHIAYKIIPLNTSEEKQCKKIEDKYKSAVYTIGQLVSILNYYVDTGKIPENPISDAAYETYDQKYQKMLMDR